MFPFLVIRGGQVFLITVTKEERDAFSANSQMWQERLNRETPMTTPGEVRGTTQVIVIDDPAAPPMSNRTQAGMRGSTPTPADQPK